MHANVWHVINNFELSSDQGIPVLSLYVGIKSALTVIMAAGGGTGGGGSLSISLLRP